MQSMDNRSSVRILRSILRRTGVKAGASVGSAVAKLFTQLITVASNEGAGEDGVEKQSSGIGDWWKDITNDYINDPQKLNTIKLALEDAKKSLVSRISDLKRWNEADQA